MAHRQPNEAWFRTRGVVLVPEDLSLPDWPERASRARLTTIAVHHQSSPAAVARFIASEEGARFLMRCERLELQVEYELHALSELLPRDRFDREPSLFAMNNRGERTPESNLCATSGLALEVVAENTASLARRLRPSTGRHFFWADDAAPWCRCPRCRDLSDSDQALLVTNAIAAALVGDNPRASAAHLAYHNTASPPTNVRPHPAVFLEFAPIHRRYDRPFGEQGASELADGVDALAANLKVFPRSTAQVLEYWLDASLFSGWRRPVRSVPWRPDIVRRDLTACRSLGVRQVTTFAAWVDASYRARWGEPAFVAEYGAALLRERA